jgi:hypothetical protein
MSLPLPSLTFYRMADRSPATSDIAGLLGALLAALQSTVDYRGTSLASTHLWTATSRTNAISITAPSGTAMTQTPGLVLAGAAAGAPTMASPDSFTASNLLMSITKGAGAWTAWDNATPLGGTNSGYWRAAGTTWNSTSAIVRVFISQEVIRVQLIGSTVTQQAWLSFGAIVEPHTTNADSGGLTAETDDRLYGMDATGGGANMTAAWLSSNASASPWAHSTTAGQSHMMVFQPGSSGLYTCGKRRVFASAGTVAESQDAGGRWVGDLIDLGRSTGSANNSGVRVGMLRGVYPIGQMQSGKVIRNGSTDLYHVISTDTTGAADALLLPAVA